MGVFGLSVVRPAEHLDELLERLEVTSSHGGLDRLLHPVVARDEGGVCAVHRRRQSARCVRLGREPPAPRLHPRPEGLGLSLEQRSEPVVHRGVRGGGGQAAEEERIVDAVRREQREQAVEQRPVVLLLARQAELGAHHAKVRLFEAGSEAIQALGREAHGLVRVLGDELEQRLREPRDVPQRDARLVRERVAARVVDGAERLARIVLVEKRARAVVDRLARDGGVVGVHDAVHEADPEPARDEVCVGIDDPFEEGERIVSRTHGLAVVPREGVGSEGSQRLLVALRSEELEGPYADVARGDAREDGARERLVAANALARRHRGERACRRYPESRHRLAHDVLPQHWAERGAAVASARKRRAAGALQLDVPPPTVLADDFAEEDRPTVAQLRHEGAELVPGVGEGNRLRPLRDGVAGEDLRPGGRGEEVYVRPEELGQPPIELHDARIVHLGGRDARVEAIGQARVRVVERKQDGSLHLKLLLPGGAAYLPCVQPAPL